MDSMATAVGVREHVPTLHAHVYGVAICSTCRSALRHGFDWVQPHAVSAIRLRRS